MIASKPIEASRALGIIQRSSAVLLATLGVFLFLGSTGVKAALDDSSDADLASLEQRLSNAGCYKGPIDGRPNDAVGKAVAACPSQDPILRIETGMHVGQLRRISVDTACDLAATASDDKTLRLWSLPDGQLVRTLRWPIGDGNQGKIFATALSPDGRVVAAGGWSTFTGLGGSAYIFDTRTGAVLTKIGEFEGVINHLAFSVDGHWLVVVLGTGGMRVVDARGWTLVAADRRYNDQAYGAIFSSDGRLFTIADDGKIRAYGPGPTFRRKRVAGVIGGKTPRSIDIDPSGRRLVVGFLDTTNVDIYEATTLTFLGHADSRTVTDANLMTVAWRTDGTAFVAGGIHKEDGKHPLLTFDAKGAPLAQKIVIPAANSVISIRGCGTGFVAASLDPAFGLIDKDARLRFWRQSVAVDMRDKLRDGLTISPTASSVRFGLDYGSGQPVRFDVADGVLSPGPKANPDLIVPRTAGLSIVDWEDKLQPKLGGRTINLQLNEYSRSLAVRQDGAGFVLGADASLRAFNADGGQIWKKAIPDTAWGVNLSSDGTIIVAAFGDGTIRWCRWSDGAELLGLFVDRSTRKWVAWTPTGYYSASPGGEDLLGWHVNRGWSQAADFFPASRFRRRFNRPDIVRLVLTTLDENVAVQTANERAHKREDTKPLTTQLPPVIQIVDPIGGVHLSTGEAKIDYTWRSPSGQPVDRIVVVVDGRPVKELAQRLRATGNAKETIGSTVVSLRNRDSEVGLIAWSGDRASEVARIKLVWDAAPADKPKTRKLYALVVGVSQYADTDMALKYAAKDAQDFAAALNAQKGRYYADVETRILTDFQVTRNSLIDGLEWLETNATAPEDLSVLFIAGHGVTDEKQTYWFFPSDADAESVRSKGVSQDEMRRSLEGLRGKIIWFLDTCHAGAAAKRPPPDVNILVNSVSSAEDGGIVVFASSKGRQSSIEKGEWGNGAFTKALVEGIQQGKADLLGKGIITTSTLDSYVENRVQELTGGVQTPVMERPPQQPDFAIAKVDGRR